MFGLCESSSSSTLSDSVVVTNHFNNQLQIYSLFGSFPPRVIAQFEEGSGPSGVACCENPLDAGPPASESDYLVVLNLSHQVRRISGDSGSVKWTLPRQHTVHGLLFPMGIALLPSGQAVVSDQCNQRLLVLDAHTGLIIKEIR